MSGMQGFIAPEFLRIGLPFISFMVIASVGLGRLISPKMVESDRRKRYVPPEPAENILKQMQENLSKQEFECVPTPGSISSNIQTMNKEQLQKELVNIREAEVWTGIPMKNQKLAVKKLIKAKGKEA